MTYRVADALRDIFQIAQDEEGESLHIFMRCLQSDANSPLHSTSQ